MHYIQIPENTWFQLTTPLTSFRAQSCGCSQTGVKASTVIQAPKREPCKDHFSTPQSWARLPSLWSEQPLGRRWLHRCPSLSCLSCSHICVHMIILRKRCSSEAHGKSFRTNSAETKTRQNKNSNSSRRDYQKLFGREVLRYYSKKKKKWWWKEIWNFCRIWTENTKNLFCSEGKGSILNSIF